MPTTTFTTRIDIELKSKLERIAKLEDREYTHYLIEHGLQKIEAGNTISENRMDSYVNAWAEGQDLPFPKPQKKRLASNFVKLEFLATSESGLRRMLRYYGRVFPDGREKGQQKYNDAKRLLRADQMSGHRFDD